MFSCLFCLCIYVFVSMLFCFVLFFCAQNWIIIWLLLKMIYFILIYIFFMFISYIETSASLFLLCQKYLSYIVSDILKLSSRYLYWLETLIQHTTTYEMLLWYGCSNVSQIFLNSNILMF